MYRLYLAILLNFLLVCDFVISTHAPKSGIMKITIINIVVITNAVKASQPSIISQPTDDQLTSALCAGALDSRSSSSGDCLKAVSLRSYVWPLNIITEAISGGQIVFRKWPSDRDRKAPSDDIGASGYATMLFRRSPINFLIHCRLQSFSWHLQQPAAE